MTLSQLYLNLQQILNALDAPAFEAACIIEHTCGYDRTQITTLGDTEANDSNTSNAQSLAKRRLEGYPLQYLLGEWEFYSLPFEVGEGVLIPRADTEILVEFAITKLKEKKSPVIADVCSGSGCIAVTLAKHLPKSKVYALELSKAAIGYINRNMALNDVEIQVISGDALKPQTVEQLPMLDAVISNPPYLTSDDMQNLMTEVKNEPSQALFGGEDGLSFYRGITPLWARRLKTGGILAYEVGANQHEQVMEILKRNELVSIGCIADYSGINRVVYGYKA